MGFSVEDGGLGGRDGGEAPSRTGHDPAVWVDGESFSISPGIKRAVSDSTCN